MKLQGKNILVTGGTGFVGSHLVEELIKQKANVVTTFLSHNPLSYFSSQKLNEKVTMVNVDICNYEKVFDVVTKFNIDYIFHLAAQALVETAYYNPKRTLYSNVMGTINVLESARLYPKIKGVIFASSDKAYGKLKKDKYLETDPLKGDHPYEVSKSAADLICYSYFKTYGLPVAITRFGNIYGEGDLNFSRIIPGIMQSVIQKKILEIRSDGKFVRDYLYVKDVIRGYILLAENIDKAKGQAYNFGSSETLSVLDLIKLIEKTLNKKIDYKILNTAKNEIPYQSLNYSKINEEFDWKPKENINLKVEKIFSWYKKSSK
ncbi:MAG: GDP-mannose 4,6-dehydratase [bacterium]|nr:GDP-mannose 4,6-dehydratase [bacterium]